MIQTAARPQLRLVSALPPPDHGADDLERLARMTHDLEFPRPITEIDCAVVGYLAALPAAERSGLWMLARRSAHERDARDKHRGRLLGAVGANALDIGWWKHDGRKVMVAVKANRFGFIYRAEVWTVIDGAWQCVSAWEYCKISFIRWRHEGDDPLELALQDQGYDVYQGVIPRNTRMWGALQIGTASLALQTIGIKFGIIMHQWQLRLLLREPMLDQKAEDKARVPALIRKWKFWLSVACLTPIVVKLLLHVVWEIA